MLPVCRSQTYGSTEITPEHAKDVTICNFYRSMRWWEWIGMVVLTIVPAVGGGIDAALLSTEMYKNNKIINPPWAPPSALFGPVWTILYLLMGFASFLIVKLGQGLNRDTIPPLFLYTLQLLFNWAWTPIFFGQGYFNLAETVLFAMWGLVVGCLATFFPVSKVAAILLVPYLCWLSFAGALNYSIVCLNGCIYNSTAH